MHQVHCREYGPLNVDHNSSKMMTERGVCSRVWVTLTTSTASHSSVKCMKHSGLGIVMAGDQTVWPGMADALMSVIL
jgi:hypothetical protein